MSERIVFADGTVFNCPEQPQAPVHRYLDNKRDWRRITVTASLEQAKAKFVDGAGYCHEWDSETVDEQGQPMTEAVSRDLSEFSIAGDVVDTRDGNITVYMGKPTEAELLQAQLAAAEQAMAEGVNSVAE